MILPIEMLPVLSYLISGIVFWLAVVSSTLRQMAATGDLNAVGAAQDMARGSLPMLIVKMTVILFWPAFLAFGLATRCISAVKAFV